MKMPDVTPLSRLKDHIASNRLLLPSQEEAVFSEAPITLVGAGAGTGKTHTLSWRFVAALVHRSVRPRDILALTFTDKAAGEMRVRIEKLFAELMPIVDPEGDRLAETAAELHEAQISTIHSFALNIVREHALFLPSGLGVRPISSPEEELFILRAERALDSMDLAWFFRHLPKDTPRAFSDDHSVGRLADAVSEYSPESVVSFSLSLADLLESRGISPDYLLSSADDPEFYGDVERRIRAICLNDSREAARVWADVLDSLPAKLKGTSAFNERIEDLRLAWPSGSLPPTDDVDAIAFAKQLFNGVLGNLSGASNSDTGKRIKEILGCTLSEHRDGYPSLVKGMKFLANPPSKEDRDLRTLLLRAAAMIWEAHRRYRVERGLLSFDDMIRLAADISSSGAVRTVRTFKEILVDEYQDTSPLQDRLIESAAAQGCRRFLVGDPKQSIYRFRHADPSIFGGRIARPSDDSRYIPLQTNFRTRPSILDEVNALFGRIWRDRIAASLPSPYEKLLFPDDPEAREAREAESLTPVIPIILAQMEDEGVDDARKRVAIALGEELMRLHGSPIWDKSERRMRPACWRDITILVPSRASFTALEETLHPLFDIPVAFEKGKRYFDRGETGDLLTAMRALAFPEERAATLGFLASPFSGLSVTEAAALLAPESPDLNEVHPEAAGRLRELRMTARYSGLSAALVLMMKDQSFLSSWPVWRRKSALANLWKGLDLVREYEEVFGNSPAGCTAYVERQAGRKNAGEENSPLGEDEDVVRVLTVHSSKGLEFPITVVMDLNNAPSGGGDRNRLIPSAPMGVGFSSLPEAWGEGVKSDTAGIARFLEEAEEREEWERLFYVALTRARDRLVLCSTCKVKEGRPVPVPGSWLSMLNFEVRESDHNARRVRPGRASPAGESAGTPVERPCVDRFFVERMSATSYSLFRYCPAAWRMKHRQGMELVWELPSSDEPGGADLGTLAHWVLSRWDFSSSSLRGLLDERHPQLPQGLRAAWSDEGGRSSLRGWLERFAQSGTGERMALLHRAGALRREMPFRVTTDGVRLVGAVDVLWTEDETVHIRDYKITAGEVEEASWRVLYAEQLLFYGYAASLAFPGLNQDIGLILLRNGREEPLVKPDTPWEEIGRQILEASSLCATGPYNPVAGRCRSCFYRKDCPYRTE